MNYAVSLYRTKLRMLFSSLAVAAILLSAAGYFLKEVLTDDNSAILKARSACLASLRTNGFNPTVGKNGDLTVTQATTSDTERFVYRSGVIIASCSAYTLTDYCAGAGCQKPGVTFTLKQKELQ